MFRKQLKIRLVVYPLVAIFLYSVFAYFFTPQIHLITKKEDASINFLVMTQEPLFVSYNPKFNKAVVNALNIPKKDLENNAFLKKPPFDKNDYFIIWPKEQNRVSFWKNFKETLSLWHYKPYLIFGYFYDYVNLRYNKKTDITFTYFLMLSWNLSAMKPADFILANYETPKTKNKKNVKKEQNIQITLGKDISKEKKEDKILVIEILNASGKKGLAAALTNYLRDLNNKGELKVDVINYTTYPTLLEETQVIDTAGRMESLKEILLKIGLETTEINTSNDKSPISEAKIIIGKDFIMPK